MAVFRVENNKGYTVMSNHHLRNKELHLSTKIGHKFLNFLQLISFFKQSIFLIYSSFFGLIDPIRFSMMTKPAFALLTQLRA